ncbi:hypothetical protein H7F16_18380 [Gemmobacter straminiformis]|uniref:Pilus assembly protein Flp/PilA n=2 Tax=Paragemmobacter straminiformis TaxID=2045119 RepID=A0A842ID13_9RHOB|nr:hypothetical protein [Gemmobacter straminiformis]
MRMLISNLMARFNREEDGLALTEYLILLGLLVGGVVAAVLLIGGDLNAAWTSWSDWFASNNLGAP